MSGIVGIFRLDGSPVEVRQLQKMGQQVAYLGPDGEGLWSSGPVGLAHRKLVATPEAEEERQPIALEGGRLAITWDGRIDNRQELLSSLGRGFPVDASTPDPCLALWAYRRWGEGCVQHLVGDYAFALWDGGRQALFCARDPMGIRPLYYHYGQDHFVLASDVRSVIAGAGISPGLDQLKVALYLMGKLNEAERTFFKGVFQVPPGHWLLVTRQGLRRERFWEPRPWDQVRYQRTEEYVEHFREVFSKAVGCRLRSPGAVGVTLSGGLDSTSIACTAAYLKESGLCPGVELHSFSSVFQDFPEVDESRYIDAVAERWGLVRHQVLADGLWAFKPLRDRGIVLGQPYPVPFQARHEALLQEVRSAGVRVLMTGEGGDELLLAGFGYLLDLMRGLHLARLFTELKYLVPRSRLDFLKMVFWYLVPGSVHRAYTRVRTRPVPQWMDQGFVRASGALDISDPTPPRSCFSSIYWRGLYLGLSNLPRLPYLSYITEMYARHGIEARHPFLDLRVVDFLSRVPAHLKFSRGWSKFLLRKATQDLLPDQVRLRPRKSAFSQVFDQGMREERTRIESYLRAGYLADLGWVKKNMVWGLYQEYLRGDRSRSIYLISLITLEDWLFTNFGSNASGAYKGLPLACPVWAREG